MLEQILEATRDRVAHLRPIGQELQDAAQEALPARDLAGALLGVGLSVIAEVKRKSPSRGVLSTSLDPITQANAYESGGAAAISVLTEPDFFAGSSRDLRSVKSSVSIPVIRKDFILDPLQVFEAKAIGADALLLIVGALEPPLLRELLQLTYELGIQAIVEAHNEVEVAVALEVGALIVGVNNRNLATFDVDLGTAEALAEMLSGVDVTVGESGIHTAADAKRMSAAGYDAVLVGEALVQADNPAGLIRDFRAV